MRAHVARFTLVLAMAAGLAAVLSVPADAQRHPQPEPEELQVDHRSVSEQQ